MITTIPSEKRYHADHGWLDTRWHFSFGDYYDEDNMNFSALRVFNDDIVHGGGKFDMHPHRDMEIITVVFDGSLRHRDSLGTGSVIRPGEVQRMTAGTGILHSEHNPSPTEPVHLLQIWIVPERRGLKPGYEQRRFEPAEGLVLVAARDGREGALMIHQDVDLFLGRWRGGERAVHQLRPGRHAWVQVARGALTVNGRTLQAGDGAAVSDETAVELAATGPVDFLLFELA
jgi:quercetin 2,3-dioxygenase